MKTFEKIFRGKISYKRIDKYVNLVRKTLDPDDEMQIEYDIQDDYQFIRIEVLDRVEAIIETPGSLTVGANTLYEIVRKLPDGSRVEFLNEIGSSQLEIVASRSRFFLSTLPKEDFPIMASEEYDFEFTDLQY